MKPVEIKLKKAGLNSFRVSRGVIQGLSNILGFQKGILPEYLLRCQAIGLQLGDLGDGHPQTPDAGLAVHVGGVNGYPVENSYLQLISLIPLPPGEEKGEGGLF